MTVVAAGDQVLKNVVLPTEPGGTCVDAPDGNANCTTTHKKESKSKGGSLATAGVGPGTVPATAGGGCLLMGGAFLLWKRRRAGAHGQ